MFEVLLAMPNLLYEQQQPHHIYLLKKFGDFSYILHSLHIDVFEKSREFLSPKHLFRLVFDYQIVMSNNYFCRESEKFQHIILIFCVLSYVNMGFLGFFKISF